MNIERKIMKSRQAAMKSQRYQFQKKTRMDMMKQVRQQGNFETSREYLAAINSICSAKRISSREKINKILIEKVLGANDE